MQEDPREVLSLEIFFHRNVLSGERDALHKKCECGYFKKGRQANGLEPLKHLNKILLWTGALQY